MKDKDFRESVKETLLNTTFIDDTVDRILAICKEMLVPEEKDTSIRHYCTTISFKEGWNACRAELLKQLGGQDNGGC